MLRIREVSRPSTRRSGASVRPVLVDTCAYAAFMSGQAVVVEVLRHAPRIHLNTVVLGELIGGFAAGSREAANRQSLSQFLDSPRVSILDLTVDTADAYAQVWLGLRRKGQSIPANDLWIAATALEHGAALLTLDAHFHQVDGLRVVERLADLLP